MDFLIRGPLSPETGYHFFLLGGGLCSEVCAQQGLNEGQIWAEMTCRPAPQAVSRPGFETPTYAAAVDCITVGPLLVLQCLFSPLLEAKSATEKTQTVCFCLPACLLARLTV